METVGTAPAPSVFSIRSAARLKAQSAGSLRTMRPWPVMVLLLAGCSSPAPPGDSGTTPTPAPSGAEPFLLADLTSMDCDYNDMIWLVPAADAQALLPTGFTARQLFADGIGAIVINAFDCGGTFAWNGWDLFVLALPPGMPAVVEEFDAANRTPRGTGEHYELDLYSLAAHTDHAGLQAVFAAAGVPVGPGSSSKQGAAMEPVPAATAVTTLTGAGQVLGQATLQGVQAGDLLGGFLTAHHRQWHVANNGTLLIERVMTNAGGAIHLTQGPGLCVLAPQTLFDDIVGPRSCNLSQDAIGGMEWTGGAYFFPNAAPLAA